VRIGIYDEATGERLMEITPVQLRQLQDALEEEFPEDRDYYVNARTLDYLFARGVDPSVIDQLREALGSRDAMDVLWRAEGAPGEATVSKPDDTEAR